jgi:hypothetical protein
MTSTDHTWAIRIEKRGLEPVVTGPLTRAQADALLGAYLDQDNDDAAENDGPTGRRITVEEYHPGDPDFTPLIPEGEESGWFHWIESAGIVGVCVAALYFAFGTYHLTLSTPRLNDVPIATGLAFIAAAGLLMVIGDAASRAWTALLRRWAASTRRRMAEAKP